MARIPESGKAAPVHEWLRGVAAAVHQRVVGQDAAIEGLWIGLLTGGHGLLAIDDGAAEKALATAVRARDLRLERMADYNLGVAQLSRAMDAETDDQARQAALAAVESSRAVLRHSPGNADAAWNLGVALRLIASLEADEPGPERRAAAARSGNPKPTDRTIPVPLLKRAGDSQARAAADGAGLSTEEIERLAAAIAEDPVRTVARVMAQARDRPPVRQQPPSNPVDPGANR